jgi:hypothetical protein
LTNRLLVLSYFEPDDLAKLLGAVRAAKLPAKTPVYVGSYGVSREICEQVQKLPNGRYAPMFHVQPGWYWERRRLPGRDTRVLLARNPRTVRLAGPLPSLPQLLRLPSSTTRVTWGVELGARFRDALRAAGASGFAPDTWQLDEIVAECAGPVGRQYRELTRGVVRGLVFGRPALGDRTKRGFVWWAKTAFVLPGRQITPELTAFWRLLDRACLGLIGEEYPAFVGDPRAAARREASGQRQLSRGGPVRRSLARRYVAGLTPGYRLAPGLGGNTQGLPRGKVNVWREAYMRTRAAAGVAGFAEFNFRFGNSKRVVMQDVLNELAEVV